LRDPVASATRCPYDDEGRSASAVLSRAECGRSTPGGVALPHGPSHRKAAAAAGPVDRARRPGPWLLPLARCRSRAYCRIDLECCRRHGIRQQAAQCSGCTWPTETPAGDGEGRASHSHDGRGPQYLDRRSLACSLGRCAGSATAVRADEGHGGRRHRCHGDDDICIVSGPVMARCSLRRVDRPQGRHTSTCSLAEERERRARARQSSTRAANSLGANPGASRGDGDRILRSLVLLLRSIVASEPIAETNPLQSDRRIIPASGLID